MSIKTDINRRDFLKGVSATSVVLSFMPGTLGAFSGEVKGSSKFVPSICEMCSTRCPIEARVDTLQEAQKVFIQGNPYSTSTGVQYALEGALGLISFLIQIDLLILLCEQVRRAMENGKKFHGKKLIIT